MECCEKQENLKVEEQSGSITVYVCQECGRRHRVMEAEAGNLGVTGTGV